MFDPTLVHQISEVKDAFTLERKVFEDDRGYFAELFREESDQTKFIQHNTSFSFGGVLRGMHMQTNRPQGKLVTCLYGTVLDVIFDVRRNSPTFLKGCAKVLDFKALNAIYAPEGCLHGFLVLSQFAVVHYSCTEHYDPESDGGVSWESPEIRQLFPEDISPTVSLKDQALPPLGEFLEKIK